MPSSNGKIELTFYDESLDDIDLSDYDGNLPSAEDEVKEEDNPPVDTSPIFIKDPSAKKPTSVKKLIFLWVTVFAVTAILGWYAKGMIVDMKMKEKTGAFKKLGNSIFSEARNFDHKKLEPDYRIIKDAEFDKAFKAMADVILGGSSGYIYRYIETRADDRGNADKSIVFNIVKGDQKRVVSLPFKGGGLTKVAYVINSAGGDYSINFLQQQRVSSPNHEIIADLVDLHRAINFQN